MENTNNEDDSEENEGSSLELLARYLKEWRSNVMQIQHERDLTMQVHILQDRYLRSQSFRLWRELSLAKTKRKEAENVFYTKLVYVNYTCLLRKYFTLLSEARGIHKKEQLQKNNIAQFHANINLNKIHRCFNALHQNMLAKKDLIDRYQYQQKDRIMRKYFESWKQFNSQMKKVRTARNQALNMIFNSQKQQKSKIFFSKWKDIAKQRSKNQKEIELFQWISNNLNANRLQPKTLQEIKESKVEIEPYPQRSVERQQQQSQAAQINSWEQQTQQKLQMNQQIQEQNDKLYLENLEKQQKQQQYEMEQKQQLEKVIAQEQLAQIANNNEELKEKIQEYRELKSMKLNEIFNPDLIAYMKTLKEDIRELIEQNTQLKAQLLPNYITNNSVNSNTFC